MNHHIVMTERGRGRRERRSWSHDGPADRGCPSDPSVHKWHPTLVVGGRVCMHVVSNPRELMPPHAFPRRCCAQAPSLDRLGSPDPATTLQVGVGGRHVLRAADAGPWRLPLLMG
jgi:hypothetical protein